MVNAGDARNFAGVAWDVCVVGRHKISVENNYAGVVSDLSPFKSLKLSFARKYTPVGW